MFRRNSAPFEDSTFIGTGGGLSVASVLPLVDSDFTCASSGFTRARSCAGGAPGLLEASAEVTFAATIETELLTDRDTASNAAVAAAAAAASAARAGCVRACQTVSQNNVRKAPSAAGSDALDGDVAAAAAKNKRKTRIGR